jgi:hypothetical protein
MGKSRHNKYNSRHLDKEYMDGNDYDARKEVTNKRYKRVDRALKTRNIDQLVELNEYDEDQYNYANLHFS